MLIPEDNIIDFCDGCGYKVFGGKMLNAIKKNMEDAKERGDLFQGSCTLDENGKISEIDEPMPSIESDIERKPFK